MAIPANLDLPGLSLSIPKNNAASLLFPVIDNDGDPVDISGFDEISFAVWDDYPTDGGVLQFHKTLTGLDITIEGDNSSFSFSITAAETGAIVGRFSYFELTMTDGNGDPRTVAAGQLRTENTYTAYIA